MIPAEDDSPHQALDALLPLQRWDFLQILSAMDGLPMTIRLLDPPLHEFLPKITQLSVRVALGVAGQGQRERPAADAGVRSLHEQNPMLGFRGVRLGLWFQGCSTCTSAHRRGQRGTDLKIGGRSEHGGAPVGSRWRPQPVPTAADGATPQLVSERVVLLG